jgi:tRNA U54 and U55 pseudouridine synthase Pus10
VEDILEETDRDQEEEYREDIKAVLEENIKKELGRNIYQHLIDKFEGKINVCGVEPYATAVFSVKHLDYTIQISTKGLNMH